jgi:hypothetical protein
MVQLQLTQQLVSNTINILLFLTHCTGTGGSFVASSDYTIPTSITSWPGNGDLTKGQSNFLAPFYDNPNGPNGADGIYTPADGDYPYYDINNDLCHSTTSTYEGNGIMADQVLKGDQTLWWVFNDKGNIHSESKGSPIGLEIRAQAFAFST